MTPDGADVILRDRDLAVLAVNAVVLLTLLFAADHLIERHPFFGRPFWALVDSGVHGLVALLVTAPILQNVQLLVLAFLAGTLVDLDHFPVVGPRSFWAATHPVKRPATRSVMFALLVSGGGYLFSGSLSTVWIVFAALAAHVLRDTSVVQRRWCSRWVTGRYRGGRTTRAKRDS